MRRRRNGGSCDGDGARRGREGDRESEGPPEGPRQGASGALYPGPTRSPKLFLAAPGPALGAGSRAAGSPLPSSPHGVDARLRRPRWTSLSPTSIRRLLHPPCRRSTRCGDPPRRLSLDRAAAALAEAAPSFAGAPAREKAAALRDVLPRLLGAAPEIAAIACATKGVDPAAPAAAEEWIFGPDAVIAYVRLLAEALEDIARRGRPTLPVSAMGRLRGGRLVAEIAPRRWSERKAARGTSTEVLFAEGVQPEDAIAAQASFYRQSAPVGGVELVLGAGSATAPAPMDVAARPLRRGPGGPAQDEPARGRARAGAGARVRAADRSGLASRGARRRRRGSYLKGTRPSRAFTSRDRRRPTTRSFGGRLGPSARRAAPPPTRR